VVEPAHEADLDQPGGEFGFPFDDLQGGLDVGGERLLTHHRLGVLEARQQLLLVGGPGVASTTASTPGSAIASSGSEMARQPGMPAAICSAFSVT